jgi:DNA-binding MarR family transcriptional regulator
LLLLGFTTSTIGLQPQFVELLRMLVERILGEVFPEETGAARLQQVGLFTLIFVLQNDNEPVTASRLATLSGQAHSEVSRQVQKLLKIGLVERAAITSPHGRGRAWHLSVKRGSESQKLLEALFGKSGKKSAAKAPSKRGAKAAKHD